MSSSLARGLAPNAKNTRTMSLPTSIDQAAVAAGDGFDDQRPDPPWLQEHHHQHEQECSMCGDIGFSSELFRCIKCFHRFQHTYCSRYYPSIPNKDVCDWCSPLQQEVNPSTAAGSTNNSINNVRPHQMTKPTNLGKRKVTAGGGAESQAASPLSSSPRKMTDLTTNMRNRKHNPSQCSSVNHKDALELLLDVAQKVAEGRVSLDQKEVKILSSQELSAAKNEQQQQQLQVEILNTAQEHATVLRSPMRSRAKNLQVEILSNHDARKAKNQQQLQVEVLSSHHHLDIDMNGSSKNQVEIWSHDRLRLNRSFNSRRITNLQSPKRQRYEIIQQQELRSKDQPQEQRLQSMKSGKDHHSQKLLTSSKSMGRRYKLLSDVLCQHKLAATNPTC